MSADFSSARRVRIDPLEMKVLATSAVFPGPPVSTPELLAGIDSRFGINLARTCIPLARRLGIGRRHICRDFTERLEAPRLGCSNPELAAEAVRDALAKAGISIGDLSYLIGHTATPAQPIPPNIALVAELLGYDGPYVEIRQACTGFANALIMAQGLLRAPAAGPVAIVGSETGSVFFDPLRACEDHGQMVNLVQMGDGAGAIVLGPNDNLPGARLSRTFFGQNGRGRPSGMQMFYGGSDAPASPWPVLEFDHNFLAIRQYGFDLFVEGMRAAREAEIDLHAADWIIPHQANGRMAQLFAPHLDAERVFVNADRIGNTGSAAIWLALAELREGMSDGQTAVVLGAEATKYMFGGFLYVHG